MNFFGDKNAQAWNIKIDCIQEKDDNSDSDNEFSLYIHACPGGGWYYKIDGRVALEDETMDALQRQVSDIARVMGWVEQC